MSDEERDTAGERPLDGSGPVAAARDELAGLWTVPNAISLARLMGVPVFLWLVLGPHADGWALGVLIGAGLSDWLDGKLARAWNQTSRYGQMLDPAADRLYIFATLIALVIRDIVPWPLAGLLILREVFVLVVAFLPARMHGYRALPVNFVGKAATLCLLYAFPLLFLGVHDGVWAEVAKVVGWAFALWGTALYWWAAAVYVEHARRLVAADRRSAGGGSRPDAGGGEPPDPGDARAGAKTR